MSESGWSAGMTAADVHAFIRRFARPVLRAAGYRQRGSKYMIDGPQGRRALIQFDAEVDAHHAHYQVSYAVFTPAHDEFRASRGVPTSPWPNTSFALVRSRVFAPEWVQTGVPVPGRILPQRWVLGTDDDHNTRVGAALASALTSEALPRIDSWFNPEGLVATLSELPPDTFAGLADQSAIAMALLDVEGSEDRLRGALDRLPPDDMVRLWIENRLAESDGPVDP